ncbi:MAG: hypothetical protein ACKOA8_00295 [Deltaproteobacteria bacterium]
MYTHPKSASPLLLLSTVWKIALVLGIILSMGAGWIIRELLKKNHDAKESVRFEKVVENISNGLDRFTYGRISNIKAHFLLSYNGRK